MVKRSQNDFLNISLAGFQKHLKNGCAFFFQRGYVQVQKKLTLHSEKSTWNLKITPSGEENHLQNLHFWFQNPNFRGYNTLFEVPFSNQIIGPPDLEALEKRSGAQPKVEKVQKMEPQIEDGSSVVGFLEMMLSSRVPSASKRFRFPLPSREVRNSFWLESRKN